jgi:hypothetical protein
MRERDRHPATELLVRLAGASDNPAIDQAVLDAVLRDWERWAGGVAGKPCLIRC